MTATFIAPQCPDICRAIFGVMAVESDAFPVGEDCEYSPAVVRDMPSLCSTTILIVWKAVN